MKDKQFNRKVTEWCLLMFLMMLFLVGLYNFIFGFDEL